MSDLPKYEAADSLYDDDEEWELISGTEYDEDSIEEWDEIGDWDDGYIGDEWEY